MSAIDRIAGTALPLHGDSIDTDRIMPARFLRAITFSGLERHLFEDDRREADARAASGQGRPHPFSDPAYARATILLVNANFGCGSSREHAPQALQRWGIQIVVGESYSEIFFGNSLALGMPCVTVSSEDADWLIAYATRTPGAPLHIDVPSLTITAGDRTIAATMPKAAHEALISGAWDATGMLLDGYDDVHAVAARLPYVRGF